MNGRQYHGDGDSPLYILHNAQIYEASIVPFGADSVTGRIAASKTPPVKEETSMSDKLKALLAKHGEKHHGLVARLFVENVDEATINTRIHAAEMDEKDKKIKAMEEELNASKAECAKLKAAIMDKPGDTAAVEHNSAPGVINEEKNILPHTSAGRSVAASAKEAADKILQAARGSNTGVQFGGGDGASDNYPKTLSAAMKHEMKAGNKLRGQALRDSVISEHPDIERM
jgi:hypothetical protein